MAVGRSWARRVVAMAMGVSALPSAIAVAHAAPTDVDALPRLAGTTAIVADHSGTFDFVIPRSAYLSGKRATALSVAGTGRYLRLILAEQNVPGADVLTYIRYPKQWSGEIFTGPPAGTHKECTVPGVPSLPLVGDIACGDVSNGQIRLHPGIYRAEVVIDRSPVTFTLHATSLSGSVQMAPTTPIYTREADISDDLGVPGSVAGGSGDDVPVSRSQENFFWWHELPGTARVLAGCAYPTVDGVPAPAGPHWLPGCPGGLPGVEGPDPFLFVSPDSGDRGTDSLTWTGPGAYSQGLSVTAAGVSEFGGLSVSVETAP